jgi:hypothetical protein
MLPIPIPSEGDAADAELRPKGLLPADADQ